MADQYQLPGQFQAPSMAEISYNAGDDNAQATAQAANFIKQWNAVTNIENANRDLSLREKQFQQLAIQNDRDYTLRREKQDQDMRNGDITFEMNQFAFNKNKEKYDQLRASWENYPKIRDEISSLLPNGGNVPNWGRVRSQIRSRFARNEADAVIVEQILADYDNENKIYSDTKVLDDQGQVQSWLESGDFQIDEKDDEGNIIGSKPIMIGDRTAEQVFSEAVLAYQQGDRVTYAAKMAPLRRIGSQRQQLRERAQDINRDLQISEATGVPIYQIKSTDKGVETTYMQPRVYGTRGTGTGTSASTGIKTYEKADIEFLDAQIKSAENSIADLDSKIAEEDSELRKAGLKAERDGLVAKKDSLQKVVDMGVKLLEQKAATQLPQTTTPQGQPKTTPGRATPQGILKAPSFPAPSTAPKPQTSANPVSSTATTTPETEIVGYVNVEGMRLTEKEAKAEQAAGRPVYPIRKPPVVANPFGAPVTSEGLKASVSG
jgi:hypothetical protein